MSKIDFSAKRYLFPPLHPEGLRFGVIAVMIAAIMTMIWHPLFFPGVVITVWVFLFFRDPDRVPPKDERAIVSPADGIVCMIQEVPLPPELVESSKPVWRVSVFMSVFNVHVNRMPAKGRIVKKHYVAGKFFNASLDKASSDNERQLYLMKTDDQREIAFVQIAGFVARRILSFVKEEQSMERSERFGLIRFGSRLDVYLPPGVEPSVIEGQIMIAGETMIASL